jgi:uncharacterized membrane protein (GlpM family)
VAFIGIPLAMLTMFLAQRLEHRLGPAAAGWFAALPISFAVASATIAVTESHGTASEIALSAAGHLGPQVAYAVAFVWAASRSGVVAGFVVGLVTYVAASLAIAPLPLVVRLVIGAMAIAAATMYMARQPRAERTGPAATSKQQVLALASAALVVALITLANQRWGPATAGTIGAFPTMSTTMAMFVAYRAGARNANAVMAGLVKSLPVYGVYCLVFAYLVEQVATVWAVAGAALLALLTAALTWRRLDTSGVTENGVLYSEP